MYALKISSLSNLLSEYPGRVESIKLHLCQSLDISISTSTIPQPFYQLRIEDTDLVTIHGIELGQGHAIDILVRNVRDTLTMLGRAECSDCPVPEKNNSSIDVRSEAKPTLVMQVKDTNMATMTYMDITNVNFRLKTRNVETMKIMNTQVDKMIKNGVEIFYSQILDISNSIFKHVDEETITVNHVDKVEVKHTLGINNRTFNFLSDDTKMAISCTAPFNRMLGTLYTWEEEKCGPVSVLPYLAQSGEGGGLGAVILTLSCVVVLVIIIIMLLLLHRRGKLEQLL